MIRDSTNQTYWFYDWNNFDTFRRLGNSSDYDTSHLYSKGRMLQYARDSIDY